MRRYSSTNKVIEIIIWLAFLAMLAVVAKCRGQGSQITQGGTAYTITTPYASDDLFEIQYVQSNDVMYLVHGDYYPQVLQHYSDTVWTIGDVNLVRGPFMPQNESEGRTITPSATTGSIVLTAAADTFYPGHADALWMIIEHVESTAKTGTLSDDGSSSTLSVGLNQDYVITTHGNWSGDLTVEKSYDGGSVWNTVYNWSSSGNYQNLVYMGTETVADATYRLTVDNYKAIPIERYQGSGEDMEVVYTESDLKYNLTALEYEREGIVRIDSVGDARYAEATVLYKLGGTAATWKWREGCFSSYRGFPAAVAIFSERLVFAGTRAQPNTIWFSQTDDWYNFLVNDLDISAMTLTIAADQLNAIRWMCADRDLVIGTSSDEWKLYTANDKSMSPTNLPSIKRQSTYGSAPIQPVVINNKIIYVQRNAKKILRTGYAIEADNYQSEDMTILAEHITGEGVTQIAYQRVPYQVLWAVGLSGDLLCCILEENQQVLGWSRYVFDGDCESVAVKPGTSEDEVWIIVKRTINGTVHRYVEQFMPFKWGSDDADAFFVDCGLSWDGGDAVNVTAVTQADPAIVTAPGHNFSDGDNIRFASIGGMTELNNKVYTVSTVSSSSFELRDRTDAVDINSVDFTAYTTGGTVIKVENRFSGLDHLEGKTVVAAADASYAGSYTVTSGAVTLGDYYNNVHIGLPYTSKIEPMNLDFLTTGGGLQGLTKRVQATTLRLHESLGGDIGPTWTDYDTLTYRQASDLLESASPFFSGDKRILFPGGFSRSGDICIRHALPLPFTLLAIIVEYEAGNK